jgi:C1A family cysteine protease
MKKRLLSIILATTMISGNCLGVNAIETLPDEIIVVDSSENEESDEITMESGDAESEIIEESANEIPAEESAEDGSAASFDASYDEAEDTIEIVLEDEEADSASFDAFFDASSEENSKDPISDHPYSTGYRSLQKSYTSQSVKEGSEFGSSFYASEKDNLPSRYITPRLPDLEDQGNYGTCWAFSSISLAEISIMNQGLSGYISSEELSQLHLAYFSYNSVTDPLDGTYGDVNASGEYGSDVLDLGGNLLLSRNVFANWTGAADSATMPYSEADSIGSYRVNDSLCYQDVAHLKNYYEESYSVYDLSPIKSLIKKCGAVGISFYAESPYCGEINSIYSSNTNSYYNSECYWPNHAVTVVGWDDDYSADNFVVRPEGNGAWLVRNSWMSGKYDDPDSWCYDGYFWLSYYDHSIDTDVHAFEFDSSDNYDNCYQYDGGMLNGETLAYKAANVFTAKGPLGSGGESLKAVSFYTPNSNVSYTVDIYTNLENPDDPESGEKCVEAETKGTTGYAGFYTVELNRSVFIPQDTTFSVVITLEKQDEYELHVGTELACRDWFIVETSALQGQSFIKPFAEAEWTDYGLS